MLWIRLSEKLLRVNILSWFENGMFFGSLLNVVWFNSDLIFVMLFMDWSWFKNDLSLLIFLRIMLNSFHFFTLSIVIFFLNKTMIQFNLPAFIFLFLAEDIFAIWYFRRSFPPWNCMWSLTTVNTSDLTLILDKLLGKRFFKVDLLPNVNQLNLLQRFSKNSFELIFYEFFYHLIIPY